MTEPSAPPSSEPPPRPRNGVQLARSIGAELDEGVVVAVLPAVIKSITSQQAFFADKKNERCHAVLAELEGWGTRLLDVQSPTDQRIRWWQVKQVAAAEGFNLVPVRWEGPIDEIPERYFEENYVTAVRFYRHGPWFFPAQKPDVLTDQQGATEATVAVETALNATEI